MHPVPPSRIDLGEVVLRRWEQDDVAALTRAVGESLDHLQPWMVWATAEAATEDAFGTFVDDCAARAADGREAVFGIFEGTTGEVLGGCGLHDRLSPGGIEIGYWLHVAVIGRGLMSRVVAHLTDLALTMDDVWWVEVRCDEANRASAAVPRRLGFQQADVIASERPQAPADTGRDMIWTRTTPIGPLGRRPPDARRRR